MSDNIAFVLALFGVVLLVVAVKYLPGGCEGDCRQGRDKCNCNTEK